MNTAPNHFDRQSLSHGRDNNQARRLTYAQRARYDSVLRLLGDELAETYRLSRCSKQIRAAVIAFAGRRASVLGLFATDVTIRTAAEEGMSEVLADIHEAIEQTKAEFASRKQIYDREVKLGKMSSEDAARQFSDDLQTTYDEKIDDLWESQAFRDAITGFLAKKVQVLATSVKKSGFKSQKGNLSLSDVSDSDLTDASRDAFAKYIMADYDAAGNEALSARVSLKRWLVNQETPLEVWLLGGLKTSIAHSLRSFLRKERKLDRMDDKLGGEDSEATKGDQMGAEETGYQKVENQEQSGIHVADAWVKAMSAQEQFYIKEAKEHPEDAALVKRAKDFQIYVLRQINESGFVKYGTAAVAARKRGQTYVYRIVNKTWYAEHAPELFEEAKSRVKSTAASYVDNIYKLRDILLKVLPNAQKFGGQATNNLVEDQIAELVKPDINLDFSPRHKFVDEGLPTSLSKQRPMYFDVPNLESLLPDREREKMAREREEDAAANLPMTPERAKELADAETAVRGVPTRNLRRRKRRPQLGVESEAVARKYLDEVRERLIRGIYRTNDWARMKQGKTPPSMGDQALTTYDKTLLDGFSSFDDYEAITSGDPAKMAHLPEEAFASHVLLRALTKAQDEFRLLEAYDVEKARALGKAAIMPLFLKAVGQELNQDNIFGEKREAIIAYLQKKILNKSVPMVTDDDYYGMDAKQRQMYNFSNQSALKDRTSLLDATKRAGAYDEARRELFTQKAAKPVPPRQAPAQGQDAATAAVSVKPWAQLTDGDLSRIADLAFDWLYGGGYQKMGVRPNDSNWNPPRQWPRLQADGASFVETNSGRTIHAYVAAMRRELKRIRKQKQGNQYPRSMGYPWAEVVDDSHNTLMLPNRKRTDGGGATGEGSDAASGPENEGGPEPVQTQAKPQELLDKQQGFRDDWNAWGDFSHEIEDGSPDINDYENDASKFDVDEAHERAELNANIQRQINGLIKLARRAEQTGNYYEAEEHESNLRLLVADYKRASGLRYG